MAQEILKKILVVDDEEDVCELIKSFLESSGYTAFTASRALNALEIVQLEKPSLVMLDIIMPDMDGIECLKRIKKIDPSIIVIMVSGLQDENVAKEAIRYGAYDYIAKPFDFAYLRDNILSRVF